MSDRQPPIYDDDDDPRYMEQLFTDEEAELLEKECPTTSLVDVRTAIIPPPMNPRTGIRAMHRYQADFIRDHTLNKLFLGGVGSGKTFTGCIDAIVLSAYNPQSTILVGAPVTRNLRDNIYTILRQLLDDFYAINGFRLERRWYKTEGRVEFINGASWVFLTYTDPEKLRGVNAAASWFDEISSCQDVTGVDEDELLDLLLQRMRGGQHSKWIQSIFTTTPKGLRGAVLRFVSRIRDGDPESGYEALLKSTYSDLFYQQEAKAKIVDLSGSYFGDVLSVKTHWIGYGTDNYTDRERPIDIGIDWGALHPVAVMMQNFTSEHGNADIIIGSIQDAVSNDDLVVKIVAWLRRHGVRRAHFYPDPADDTAIRRLKHRLRKAAKGDATWHLNYTDDDVHSTTKAKYRGFHATLRMLHDRFRRADGTQRLYFARHIRTVARNRSDHGVGLCFLSYEVDVGSGKAPHKSPFKHMVDATRYIIIHKYLVGADDREPVFS